MGRNETAGHNETVVLLWVPELTCTESLKPICFKGTWRYIFTPPIRKMTKRSHDVNEKGYLSCAIDLFLVASAFLMSSIIKLNYFWGKDLSFFLLLIKLFGHFNLSILKISSHFKWDFFVNAKNVVVFFVILCGANETSDRCLICPTQVVNVWWKNFFFKVLLEFFNVS